MKKSGLAGIAGRRRFPAISVLIILMTLAVISAAARRSAPVSGADEHTPSTFLNETPSVATRPQVDIAAVGDIMLGSWIVDKVAKEGVDAPFDSTRSWIESADITVGNLEAPFADGGRRFVEKQYSFKVPTYMAQGVANAGFDIVTLANNHILDYGCEALVQTINTLEALGVRYCGAGMNIDQACAPTMIEVNGLRLAFIGLTTTYPDQFWATPTRCGTCHASEEALETIFAACREADLTVVNIHWGTEKKTTPNSNHIEMARRFIDLGADLVLGHHPHVLQGIEIYKGRLIAYSLGNYVFGSYSENAHTSMILRVLMGADGLVEARIVPIHVYNAVVQFQPKVLKGDAKIRLIRELQALSAALNGGGGIIDDEGKILPRQTAELITP